MKAIIMAGGQGTRLKAVSGDTPKPLVPLCGKPIMEHIVTLLKENGFTDICVTLKYRPQDITDYFGDGSRFGVKMQYRIEQEALGTAGGVKNCADFYGDEDFLVISGDAACDFDLAELYRKHRDAHSDVSIALYPHPEPLPYGLTVCDRSGRVRAFIEKPDWPHVVTNLVNTGIYVISPAAMDKVPSGKSFDFAKDLFPEILKSDGLIQGIPADGYWCDIGTPKSYYECCADALSGRLNIEPAPEFKVEKSLESPEESGGELYGCKDRARLMGSLSELFLDMGADFSGGLYLKAEDYEISISPCAAQSALRIRASASDAETAKELSLSVRHLLEAAENRLE